MVSLKEREKVIRFAKVEYSLVWEKYFDKCRLVLDAGCGEGPFFNVHPERCVGLDLNKSSMLSKGRFVKGDLCNLPFKSEYFDGIFCAHTMEHIQDNTKAIKEFYRVLKPKGKLVIITPSQWTLFVPFSKYNFFSEPTHVRPYTPFSIKTLLEWSGFNVKKTCYNEFYIPFVRSIFRKINNDKLYSEVVKRLSVPIPPFELFAYAEKK